MKGNNCVARSETFMRSLVRGQRRRGRRKGSRHHCVLFESDETLTMETHLAVLYPIFHIPSQHVINSLPCINLLFLLNSIIALHSHLLHLSDQKNQKIKNTTTSLFPSPNITMGCAPSKPSRPPPQKQPKPTPQRQPKPTAARLSRPFDWDAPLHPKPAALSFDQRHGDAFAALTARSSHNHPRPAPPSFDQRHGDAFALLTANGQKNAPPPRKTQAPLPRKTQAPPPRKTQAPSAKSQKQARLSRPFDPQIPVRASRPFDQARHGDALAQLNGRSRKSQAPRKDQKVRFEQGSRVKSQKVRAQGFKSDTLYFAN